MLSRLRPHLSFANVVALTALVTVIAGGTWAIGAIPDSQGRISACYQPTNVYRTFTVGGRPVRRLIKQAGEVRLLVTGTRCRRGERKLVWNQQGPPGLQGAQGIPGTPGTAGTPGQQGANGATQVAVRVGSNAASTSTAQANCQPGERATGGGYFHNTGGGAFRSEPTPNTGGTPTGWLVSISGGTFAEGLIVAYAVCASP